MGMTERVHGPEDFERVATPYLPLLWRCARRLVQTGHEAEDLVQETCLKAFRAWQQFQAGTDARAWLVTILLNTARDWGRKTLRQPETLGLDALTTLLYQDTRAPARTATPEHAAAQAEVSRLVRLALDDLSPEFRLTVLLADVEECTYKEIADIMGCPIGTVMSRLYRARHLLRLTLQTVLEE
jgi:RNA polymerase sigma-70 factor (ECF subfamily)